MKRTGEIVAPLPICFGTLGFYVLPRAAYLMWSGRAPLTSADLLPEDQTLLVAEALGLTVLGAVAFVAGHRAHSAVRAAEHVEFNVPDPDHGRAIWVAATLSLAAAAAAALLLRQLGSIENAIAHQHEVSLILRDKQPLFQLTRLLIIPTALLLVDPVRRRSRVWVWFFAVAATVAFFPLGRRSFMVLAAAYPLALYHLLVRRLPLRWIIPVTLLGSGIVFSLGYIRLLGISRVTQAAGLFVKQPSLAVHFAFNASGELKVFDAMTIVVRSVPREMSFNFGETFLRVPWMIVPRQLWVEKPVTLGEVIVQRYVPRIQAGYPPMAVGEFYAAGGPFAVVLGFFYLGWVARVGWEWYRRRAGAGNASVYLTFCFFIFDFTRVGDPSRTIWFFLLGFGFLSLAFSIAARPAIHT